MRVICDAKNWSAAAYVRTSNMVCMIGSYRGSNKVAADDLPIADTVILLARGRHEAYGYGAAHTREDSDQH